MLSPSEIVRRIERARLPTSKSSYSQSSAFQIAISLCFVGSGFGFFTGALSLSCDLASRRMLSDVALVQPLYESMVLQVSSQAAVDLNSRSFEEANESIEAWPHIGGLQGQ